MSELKTNLEQILQEKNEKIISQNIKKDIEVLGVTGSYDKEDIKELQDELADAEQELADVRRDLNNSTATISGSGEVVTLNGTAEARFKKAPLPLGNTEQEVIEAQAGTTVEGESISASGVDLSKVEILNINGNTKQETTTGKNKIISFKTRNSDFVEYFFDKSINNSFIMSGLSNLTVSGFKVTIKTSNGDINLGYKNIETNKNFSFTFSITTDDLSKIQNSTSTPFIQFWSSAGFTEADFKNVMIRDSSITDDTYEPYTGGIASPNPDYPQEMHSAGANINLLDISQVMIGKAWNNASNSARAVVYMKCDPSTTYTISFNNISNFDGVYNFEKTSPEDTTAIVGVSQITTTKTITTNANSSYLGIQFNKSSVSASDFIGLKIKIEKGDKATAYSAYNQGNMNVEISNKNLWNGELEQNAWNNSDGTTTVWSNQYIRSKSFIEVKSNTIYTLNYSMLNNEVKNGNILLYDKDKNFINSLQTPNNLTFTTSSTTKYLKLNFYAGAGASVEGMSNLQIEEGSTATTYVAHEGQSFIIPTQQPFRKIGNTKDTFVKKVDGKWYEKHAIAEVVLDGSEDEYWWNDGQENYLRVRVNDQINAKPLSGSGDVANALCNSYIVESADSTYVGQQGIAIGSTGKNILIFDNNFNYSRSVSDYRVWLSTHNLIFDYELETPTYIECTSEQSAILDQINTFYETTNIFSTDEVSPNFTFTYNKVYASPSPDDESPIQTVSGDVKVVVGNKNLFNKDNIKTIDYYIQPIAPNPGEHIYSLNNRNCEIEVEPNTDYIRNIVKVNNMTFWSSITFYDKDHVFISGLWSPDNIITTPSNAKYMILSTSGNVSSLFGDELVLETYYNSLQLEKGTTLTNYVEHREQVLSLTLKSKNLFDKTRIISTNQGNWEVVQITDGVRIIHKNSYYTGTPKVIFKLKPNTTYTYSQNEAAGFSIQPDGGTKQYANTNQMTVTTRTFRNINYRICRS